MEKTSSLSPKIEIPVPFLVVRVCVVRSCRRELVLIFKGLRHFRSQNTTVLVADCYGIRSQNTTVSGCQATEFSTAAQTYSLCCTKVQLLALGNCGGKSKVGIHSYPPVGQASCSNGRCTMPAPSAPQGAWKGAEATPLPKTNTGEKEKPSSGQAK